MTQTGCETADTWRARFDGHITSPAEDSLANAVQIILARLDMHAERLDRLEKRIEQIEANLENLDAFLVTHKGGNSSNRRGMR